MNNIKKRRLAYLRKLKRVQVTCLCGNYNFPHRINGGKCNGREWALSYYELEHLECKFCLLNNNGVCEVAEGQEEIKYCRGFLDHLHSLSFIRHPKLNSFVYAVDELESIECPF